jgi:hypothetical protein
MSAPENHPKIRHFSEKNAENQKRLKTFRRF